MGIAILNPAITSISGRVGGIVFYTHNDNTYFRSYVVPRNPDTPAQRSNRGAFRDAMKAWQALSSFDREGFARRARRLGMAGHNLFISRYMLQRPVSRTDDTGRGACAGAVMRGLPSIPEPSPSLHSRGLSVTGSIPCHMTPNASGMPDSLPHGP
ncbi:MAG TPA: hypothetical protein P5346_06260 [Spirochaetota bacterium]|nr:hypothetical protein [Spirochaetota bacterium]HSA14333.1 hypothetical protein [Spirochaetota bacterium]